MAKEIELKLALPESAQRAFLRHAQLKSATARQTAQVVSIYYDTPDLALKKSGVAVRLRRQGRTWLQTVKCAGSSAGGLSDRPEWETPYGDHFDFSAVDDSDVRARLEKRSVLSRLTPLFETSFRRTTWNFGNMLLMFDRGWIAAAGRREAISELEFELAGGEVGDLFALAEALAERLPLLPAPLSKAERGIRLHLNAAPSPTRADRIPLTPEMSPQAAFRAVALSCLDQMQRNHAGAVSSEDPEYIHQMRVATRRLRACLRLFAPVLPPGHGDALLPALHEMMAPLGKARDLDVLLMEICAPVTAALPEEPRLSALAGIVTEDRHTARRNAVRALESRNFGQLMIRYAALLHAPIPAVPDTPQSVGEFADSRLRNLRRKVHARARAARLDDPASLHALRIGIKRLRYALEFFATLARGKSRRRLAEWLAEAQGTLGELNDLANAGSLLMTCAGHDERLREAVTLIGGWHGPRHARLMARLPKLLEALLALSHSHR
ncbi:MAG: CHAD domain-containing protein [Gammaproteobacteria bacterium]|nr:CHAD domain-containing protein [Gammaproteobacteria bacterium]MBU1415795.1 CHAD domain-containing protein [Gammaproteobacteria bacterium]